ncbi:MAG: hypothetical protein PVJ98_08650 [Akkermansiaceae bacterium]|jgi:hypothetical protein
MKKVTFPRSVILVTLCYLIAAIVSAYLQKNWEFLRVYIPFFVLVSLLVAFMHRRVNFSLPILWALSLWGAMHLAGGLVPLPDGWAYQGPHQVLYSWWIAGNWLKYDMVVHAYGFGAATWLTWEAFRASVQQRLGRKLFPSVGMVALCVLAGMGLGALNELVEFAAVLNLPDTNVGGYFNTGWDLVFNLVGCCFAGLLILFRG